MNDTTTTIEINGEKYKMILEEITEEPKQEPENRKTGYERAGKSDFYYVNSLSGDIYTDNDTNTNFYNELYKSANYYTDEQLAIENARADELMRRLRRFSAEHRKNPIDWGKTKNGKFCIYYNYNMWKFNVERFYFNRHIGVHFDTTEAAQLAIDTFHDDLVWYFTEYEDTAEFREV